jgi:hypothetical protein
MEQETRWLRTCSECSKEYYMSHNQERRQFDKLMGLKFSLADICSDCFPLVLKKAREVRGFKAIDYNAPHFPSEDGVITVETWVEDEKK